jgi:SAM-dependent methyltransferase
MAERDYLLGTQDEEIQRLGLQHRVWRPTVLKCWRDVGIGVGSKVLDVGAGPGYATVDLAEIVGPGGGVTSVERSTKFVNAIRQSCLVRALTNVKIHELDLMTDDLPVGDYDFSWCRWVVAFVSDPLLLVKKIGGALRKGGRALFYEYAGYETWRFAPSRENHERFRGHVVEAWRASGGEPDIGLALPDLLGQSGFVVRSATPHIFCFRPNDYIWQWPATFIETGLARLKELGRIDEQFAGKVRAEFAAAEADPTSLMLTPLVLEIVAEKL